MPRIRRRRDVDWTPTDEDFPEIYAATQGEDTAGDESTDAVHHSSDGFDTGRSTDPASYEGYSDDSGQSWLSNAVIIGSLPDNKLKAALARYKAIVRLCEAELAARAVVPKRRAFETRRCNVLDRTQNSNKPTQNTRLRKAKSLLTPEQLAQALMMLIKLKETKNGQ